MTTAMRKIKYTLIALAAMSLFSGCFQEFHEAGEGTGVIIPSLKWELPDDAGTPIHHLLVVVNGPAASFSKVYTSPEALAANPLVVPDGEYDLLFAANMSEDDGFLLEGVPATKADKTSSFEHILAWLKDPSSSPDQGYFAGGHASVSGGRMVVVQPELQRLLATVTLNVKNVPSDAIVEARATGPAAKLDLSALLDDGRYGVPGSATQSVTIGNNATVNIMPTASGLDFSSLTLVVKDPNGPSRSINVNAPLMKSGESYNLDYDFNILTAVMELKEVKLAGWKSASTITAQTKADAVSSSEFQPGAEILLYAWTGSNAQVPAQRAVDGVVNKQDSNNKWMPVKTMYWLDERTQHYFLGLSPVQEVSSFSAFPFTLSTESNEASDLLIATDLNGCISGRFFILTFTHATAKLVVNLEFSSQWTTPPTVSSVKVDAYSSATVDLLTKAFTPTGSVSSVALFKDSNISWTGLQVPQTGVRTVSVEIDGQTFQYESPTDIPLEGGKVTTLNLFVGRDNFTSDSSISDWVDGETLPEGSAE